MEAYSVDLRERVMITVEEGVDTRKAQALTRFYQLLDLWKDPDVNISLKISLYRSLVISKFSYGHVAWLLDAKTLQFVNGFNSMTADIPTAFARRCMENFSRVRGFSLPLEETEHLHDYSYGRVHGSAGLSTPELRQSH